MCRLLRKSACPFGQVQTKMYLPESPFFKDSLAGASGLVLMSVPVTVFVILFFVESLGKFDQQNQAMQNQLNQAAQNNVQNQVGHVTFM